MKSLLFFLVWLRFWRSIQAQLRFKYSYVGRWKVCVPRIRMEPSLILTQRLRGELPKRGSCDVRRVAAKNQYFELISQYLLLRLNVMMSPAFRVKWYPYWRRDRSLTNTTRTRHTPVHTPFVSLHPFPNNFPETMAT